MDLYNGGGQNRHGPPAGSMNVPGRASSNAFMQQQQYYPSHTSGVLKNNGGNGGASSTPSMRGGQLSDAFFRGLTAGAAQDNDDHENRSRAGSFLSSSSAGRSSSGSSSYDGVFDQYPPLSSSMRLQEQRQMHPLQQMQQMQQQRMNRGGGGGVRGGDNDSSGGGSGVAWFLAIIVILGGLGVGGYFLYRRLRKKNKKNKKNGKKGKGGGGGGGSTGDTGDTGSSTGGGTGGGGNDQDQPQRLRTMNRVWGGSGLDDDGIHPGAREHPTYSAMAQRNEAIASHVIPHNIAERESQYAQANEHVGTRSTAVDGAVYSGRDPRVSGGDFSGGMNPQLLHTNNDDANAGVGPARNARRTRLPHPNEMQTPTHIRLMQGDGGEDAEDEKDARDAVRLMARQHSAFETGAPSSGVGNVNDPITNPYNYQSGALWQYDDESDLAGEEKTHAQPRSSARATPHHMLPRSGGADFDKDGFRKGNDESKEYARPGGAAARTSMSRKVHGTFLTNKNRHTLFNREKNHLDDPEKEFDVEKSFPVMPEGPPTSGFDAQRRMMNFQNLRAAQSSSMKNSFMRPIRENGGWKRLMGNQNPLRFERMLRIHKDKIAQANSVEEYLASAPSSMPEQFYELVYATAAEMGIPLKRDAQGNDISESTLVNIPGHGVTHVSTRLSQTERDSLAQRALQQIPPHDPARAVPIMKDIIDARIRAKEVGLMIPPPTTRQLQALSNHIELGYGDDAKVTAMQLSRLLNMILPPADVKGWRQKKQQQQ